MVLDIQSTHRKNRKFPLPLTSFVLVCSSPSAPRRLHACDSLSDHLSLLSPICSPHLVPAQFYPVTSIHRFCITIHITYTSSITSITKSETLFFYLKQNSTTQHTTCSGASDNLTNVTAHNTHFLLLNETN